MEPTVEPEQLSESGRFLALDVETANSNITSICQLAVVFFEVDKVIDIWHSFVNPGEPFAAMNVALHGIDACTVHDAPNVLEVLYTVSSLLAGRVVVSHMPFDRISLQRTFAKHNIPPIQCSWLDTAAIARRAWPRFAKKGYRLKSVASWCGIDFRHHDAVEDAVAAGRILSKAIVDTGIGIDNWLNSSTSRKFNGRQTPDGERPRVAQNRRSSLRYTALDARQFRSLSSIRESRP